MENNFLSEKALYHLKKEQRRTKDRSSYIKVTTILMLNEEFTPLDIEKALGIDGATIYRYFNNFQEGKQPLDFLNTHYKAPEGKMSDEDKNALKTELSQKLYSTLEAIKDWLLKERSIQLGVERIRIIVKELGFRYKKTKIVPCKQNQEAQEKFIAETLNPLLAEARAGNAVVLYLDGVHPTHNHRPHYGWILSGQDHYTKTVSGRHRVNINGAVNALDPSEVLYSFCEKSINGETSKALYDTIRASYPGQNIYVIHDNARYNHSIVLRAYATELGITQVYLPSYSPNLNPIERLWKHMKKAVIDGNFYPTKADFEAALEQFFKELPNHKKALRTLMTLNFHIV